MFSFNEGGCCGKGPLFIPMPPNYRCAPETVERGEVLVIRPSAATTYKCTLTPAGLAPRAPATRGSHQQRVVNPKVELVDAYGFRTRMRVVMDVRARGPAGQAKLLTGSTIQRVDAASVCSDSQIEQVLLAAYLKNIKVGVTYNLMDTKQSFIYKFREIAHNNVTACLP